MTVTSESLRRHADIIARHDDPDTATALRWAASEIDRLRAALAAAQAGGDYEPDEQDWSNSHAYGEGFAAGIEAAAQEADKELAIAKRPVLSLDEEIQAGQVGASSRIAAAIRALRPPAAPAGAQPSEEDFEEAAKQIHYDMGCTITAARLTARRVYLALFQQSGKK